MFDYLKLKDRYTLYTDVKLSRIYYGLMIALGLIVFLPTVILYALILFGLIFIVLVSAVNVDIFNHYIDIHLIVTIKETNGEKIKEM